MREAWAALFVLCLGCSSTSSAPGQGAPGPNGDGGATGDGGTVGPDGSFTITFGPVTVPPGVEKTQCVTKRLGNPSALHVGTIHNTLGNASHHMIVYRVNDTTEQTTPYDCQPFTDTLDPTKGSPLMITQKKDEVLTLPQGVAYSIAANQMLRLEMHYINPGSAAVDLTSTSTLIPIADADFKDEADFLFIGNPDVSLPPNATTTLGPSFFKLPADYADAKFFALTGHEHHLGTNVQVQVATSKTDPGTAVYDVPGWNWAEPKTVFPATPFTVPSGSGFRFTCSWNNTTSQTVSFGESANNEMCFFWAYYYPSKGAKVCFHTDRLGGVDQCCPGSNLCAALGN
jgi:hypothetical protein